MRPQKLLLSAMIFCLLLVVMSAAAAFCQSPPQPSQPSQVSQSQPQAQQKEESVADAARKAKAKKAKSESGKVYTEEDISTMRGGGVSVVGNDNRSEADSAGSKDSKGKAGSNIAPMSGQDEAYWRGKARKLLDEMAAVDRQIAKLKDDIKKYGSGGFDVNTGMKDSVVYVEDRNAQVQELEKRKTDLEKKLDQLQEDGRKAGASPAWFR